MEHATEKQKCLIEAQLAHETARRNLEDKILAHSATQEDFQAVVDASESLKQAEEMRVSFECNKGCEKPKAWTTLYQDLDNENAHLKGQVETSRATIEQERTTSSQEVRNLQEELNAANERLTDLASDLEVAIAERIEADKQRADVFSEFEDFLITIQQLKEAKAQLETEKTELQAAVTAAGATIQALEQKLANTEKANLQASDLADGLRVKSELLITENQALQERLDNAGTNTNEREGNPSSDSQGAPVET
jgi:chromosome segregation ATPase